MPELQDFVPRDRDSGSDLTFHGMFDTKLARDEFDGSLQRFLTISGRSGRKQGRGRIDRFGGDVLW